MAYLLRSMAVIGVIAWNSPVFSERSPAPADHAAAKATPARAPVSARTAPPRGLDIATLAAGGTATREALEILSNLDPETRTRLIEIGLRTAAPQR